MLRNAWYVGALADELGDKPLAGRHLRDPVMLFRDDSGTAAAALVEKRRYRGKPLPDGGDIHHNIWYEN
jgi:hypothetical protein